MPLRILMVTDVYPPIIGGAERQIQLLSKKLIEREHTVCVATAWQVGLQEQEDDQGVYVYRLKGLASRVPWFSINPQRRHHPPFPDPATVWRLRQIIDSFQPDVIHAYGWIIYSCAVALLGKDIPLVLSVREYSSTCALRTMLRYGRQPCDGPSPAKCLDCATHFYGKPKGIAATVGVYSGRVLLRWKVRGIHNVSTYMQQVTQRDLFPEQANASSNSMQSFPNVVIPSFRDSKDDQPSHESQDVQDYVKHLPDQTYILFVGALRLVKGLEPLLAAYQRLNSPPPLVLIGPKAPDTPQHFPANVTVLHNFPHRAVMAAWERALFGVAPSIWPEPFGSVVHEGMSKGKAYIGTAPGGQTDMIIPGKTGLLVAPKDVEALTKAMQRLIDDEELRERLGQAGRERARLFSSEIVVPRFEQLYRQVIDASSRPAAALNIL